MTIPSEAGRREVWISLLSLSGPHANPILKGACGAHSNVLLCASDENEFTKEAHARARELGLTVGETLWAVPLANRPAKFELGEHLLRIAEEVATDGATRFGVFHAWEEDDLTS